MMTRRELLTTVGVATLIACRGGDRSKPSDSRPTETTVTLTVDGMI